MAFKETPAEFRLIDIDRIEPDPAQPRRHCDEAALKGLANSISSKGLIHPLVVLPANADGRYRLIVGERRWRAARLAGETQVPVLVRACDADECREIQVFENLGLGLRVPLEPREMATAIQGIAERFESRQAAADHFGRNATWLDQATAAANLSPKVTALLDAGRISGTGTAVQLDRLARQSEATADRLIDQVEQLPEGKKLLRSTVDNALVAAGLRRGKKEGQETASETGVAATPPVPPVTPEPLAEAAAPAPAPAAAAGRRLSSGKIRLVAEILGVADGDEETVLARLVDEFLAMQGDAGPPF